MVLSSLGSDRPVSPEHAASPGRRPSPDRFTVRDQPDLATRPGPLLIVGGAEDRRGRILERFVALAGGRSARIVVLTTAASQPEQTGETYRQDFVRLGAGSVEVLEISQRPEASSPEARRAVAGASGVFFTGGDQLRVTSALGGTPLDAVLRRRWLEGAVVAGTSAGASAMSETMIVEGDSDDAPKKCTIKMAPGMGFLEGVVVDQHFAQRGRLGRLLAALAQNPKVLGLGIDEDTSVVVLPDKTLWVVGSQTVTVLDGRGIVETNASESSPDEALVLTDVILHVLPDGYGFDLRTRRPLPASPFPARARSLPPAASLEPGEVAPH